MPPPCMSPMIKKAGHFQIDHFSGFPESDLDVVQRSAILAMDVASKNRLENLMQPGVFEVHSKLFLLVCGCCETYIVNIPKWTPSSWKISCLLVQDRCGK